MQKPGLKRELTLFDITCLVIGSIVGADIFIASGIAAGLIGPASIFVWLAAGLLATAIAVCFARCAVLYPRVGGPYAWVSTAFGRFWGFMSGWSLWLAEWSALAVFPVAFTLYLKFFFPLTWAQDVAVKGLLILFLTATNWFGIRAAGKSNDVLTLAKLAPLLLFVIAGLVFVVKQPAVFVSNYQPLLPLGFGGFGAALALIFWAYAGFELASIPAGEVRNPGKTIPKAIMLGMAIVMAFYLSINVFVYGAMPWSELAREGTPLVAAGRELFNVAGIGVAGVIILVIGALLSVSGSDESGTIGTSRLSYAMAADGMFPRFFAKLHPKYRTPYLGIIVQNSTAFIAAVIGGIIGLISFSVFCMAVAYVATILAYMRFRRHDKSGLDIVAIAALLFSLFMITQIMVVPMLFAMLFMLGGIPLYVHFAPKRELRDVKKRVVSTEYMLRRIWYAQQRFLAHALRKIWEAIM